CCKYTSPWLQGQQAPTICGAHLDQRRVTATGPIMPFCRTCRSDRGDAYNERNSTAGACPASDPPAGQSSLDGGFQAGLRLPSLARQAPTSGRLRGKLLQGGC